MTQSATTKHEPTPLQAQVRDILASCGGFLDLTQIEMRAAGLDLAERDIIAIGRSFGLHLWHDGGRSRLGTLASWEAAFPRPAAAQARTSVRNFASSDEIFRRRREHARSEGEAPVSTAAAYGPREAAERASRIIGHPAAAGQMTLALQLAKAPGVSIAQAIAALEGGVGGSAMVSTSSCTPMALQTIFERRRQAMRGAGDEVQSAATPSTPRGTQSPAAVYARRSADVRRARAKHQGG